MGKGQRIAFFTISLGVLFGIYKLWQSELASDTAISTVIFTSLIMLSFVTLFLEHWFTKPTDVLASAISILLVLAPLRKNLDQLGVWYEIFFSYTLIIALSALFALVLLDGKKSSEAVQNKISSYLRGFATTFGNGRLLYFSLFILAMLFYIDNQSKIFLILFGYSAIIILADPKRFIIRSLTKSKATNDDIGEIFGVQSKNTFLVKLYNERQSVRRFDFVEFRYSMEENKVIRKGLIVDNYLLNQEQWIKVLTTSDISRSIGADALHDHMKENVVYKISPIDSDNILDRFVGSVAEDSNILKIRFEYGGKSKIAEGALLEVFVGDIKVLYQVVQGTTNVELLDKKNEAGLVIGHATQIGIWNAETLTFDKFGWVPDVNSPIYLASSIDQVDPPADELIIGNIPETKYPVLLNKDEAVTHHLAILGITGSGKSVFARNLIRELASGGTKFICVDFTNEYAGRFADLGAEAIIAPDRAEKMFASIDIISDEMAQFSNKRNPALIAKHEDFIRLCFTEAIEKFLKSANSIAIFELPDVSNTTGILDYTQWFFKVLFEIAKAENNFGNQVCVVLEEAHTVVPEWNFVGTEDKGAKALVNRISQIALQGRKYNIGFMVIAQRTANVSKTVLTQCNTIVAFQQFDRTSADFLTNYMGKDMVEALPMLRPRQAIAVGKAFRSGMPMIFSVPDIDEPELTIEPEPSIEPEPVIEGA